MADDVRLITSWDAQAVGQNSQREILVGDEKRRELKWGGLLEGLHSFPPTSTALPLKGAESQS